MKITKYGQSCVLVEESKKILIDPGDLVKNPEELKADILLITHRHSDHCFPENIKIIQKNNPDIKIFCNNQVKEILNKEGIECELVKTGDVIEEDSVKIEVVKAVHGYIPKMGKGYPKDNDGYIIEDGLRIYHCSDTICFENEFKVDVILVPICGHGVVMEPRVAVEFCEAINPRLTIPIHYEGVHHPNGFEKFEEEARKVNLKYKVLEDGESVELK